MKALFLIVYTIVICFISFAFGLDAGRTDMLNEMYRKAWKDYRKDKEDEWKKN